MLQQRKETVRFTAATGAIVEQTGTKAGFRVYREATGIYHLVFPAGEGRPLAEYHFSLTALGAAQRTLQLSAAAAPVGAALTTGETSQAILGFTDAAAAGDPTEIIVVIERR